MICSKIVLTGGPCAGKTTALSKLEQSLEEKGYTVFIVSESATEMIKSGIRPFGEKALPTYQFQYLNMKHQINKENLFEEAVQFLPKEQKCVLLYDRGLLDNKAYMSEAIYKKILKDFHLKESNLMDSYDLVLHLVTAADGAENFYTLENNAARTETKEEAIILDQKTMQSWVGHRNLKIVDNEKNFADKMDEILECVYQQVGTPIPLKRQRKFLVDLSKINIEAFLSDKNAVSILLEQTYTKSEDGNERRLRKKIIDDEEEYYFTVQKKGLKGKAKVVTDKKVDENTFYKLMDAMKGEQATIQKVRHAFTMNKQYFRLDVFENRALAILEIEPTRENKKVVLPDDLQLLREITEEAEYQNEYLAFHTYHEKKHRKVSTHISKQ